MKNIVIFGSSRAGKSTLSKMIFHAHPSFQIYVGDDIRGAFQNIIPELQINSKGGKGMEETFPAFISFLFYKSIKRNIGVFNYILETCDITPKLAKKYFDRDDTIIIFLATPRLSDEEWFNQVRFYETERDWTFGRSDEEIRTTAGHWTKASRQFEKECKEENIWFVDTSFDRERVLAETLQKLEKILSD